MVKKTEGREKMSLKMAQWQEHVVAEQTTSRPTIGRLKSPIDSSHELDPDEDITLILNYCMSISKQEAHQVQNKGTV